MARVYVFTDEAGDFTFARKPGASRYFIIGSVTMAQCSVGTELLHLRRELAFNGMVLAEFHASNDRQRVRDSAFEVIASSDLRIDATILDKTKAQDHLREDPLLFYKQALFLHFKYVAQKIARRRDELFIVTSSLQIRKKKQAVRLAAREVVEQVSPTATSHTAFWPAISDPCLQVADYATWAIQRKHETGDERAYDLIENLVASEFQPFRRSDEVFY